MCGFGPPLCLWPLSEGLEPQKWARVASPNPRRHRKRLEYAPLGGSKWHCDLVAHRSHRPQLAAVIVVYARSCRLRTGANSTTMCADDKRNSALGHSSGFAGPLRRTGSTLSPTARGTPLRPGPHDEIRRDEGRRNSSNRSRRIRQTLNRARPRSTGRERRDW